MNILSPAEQQKDVFCGCGQVPGRNVGGGPEGEEAAVPRWLLEKQELPPAGAAPGHRRRRGFLERTLHDFTAALKDEIFSEQLAGRRGLLQNLDPRVKLVTVLFLIGVTGFYHHVFTLVCFNLWLFWLAGVSGVPLKFFVKRVWVVVLLFTGILVFPALFNFVRPGAPLFVLFHFGHPVHLGPWTIPAEVAVTRQGAEGALLMVLRVGASVSLAALLTFTTRWSTLLKAFQVLRIPGVFLAVLEMAYRYIFLLLQISSEMFVARKSRTVGRTTTGEQRRFIASAIAALWNKAYVTSEEVHAAMLSRGYSGQPKTLAGFRTRRTDWLWAGLVLLAAGFFLGGDRLFG